MNQRITDLETALIFLREARQRTKNLQNSIADGKATSPDIPYRIERIEGTIRRFENEISDYRTDLINAEKEKKEEADKKRREEEKAKRREERAAKLAARHAAEEAERKAVKEAEKEARDA